MARAFHVCFMNLIVMTALTVSNAVLILIKTSEIINFLSKKGVFYTCCKRAKHYNIKSVSQWGTAGVFAFVFVFLLRSCNLRNDILVWERSWVELEQYLWFFIDSHFLLFFMYVFIHAFCCFSMHCLKV